MRPTYEASPGQAGAIKHQKYGDSYSMEPTQTCRALRRFQTTRHTFTFPRR